MASFQSLPGFREFYPEDCAARNALFAAWRDAALLHGFQEYDAPVLEPLELYTEKSGEEIKSQLFEFTDKGGRNVALRPEMTPSLARLVAARAGSLPRPLKWFSLGEMYRYEKPQKGRLRAFYQFNADILGEPGPAADAECIALLIDALLSSGLKEGEFEVRISHRKLWYIFLNDLGLNEQQGVGVLSILDKWNREEKFARIKKLAEICPNPNDIHDEIERLLTINIDGPSYILPRGGTEELILQSTTLMGEINEISRYLKAYGFDKHFRIDLSIVRGLAYYTGFVFEAYQTVGTARALAGGGRYDDLIKKLGGPDMPAVGFAIGDVTMTDLLHELGRGQTAAKPVDIYVAIVDEDQSLAVRSSAMRLVAQLRGAGLRVDYPLAKRKEDKQFKAAKDYAQLWIAVGPEQTDGPFRVKSLETKVETSFANDADFVTNLRNLLAGAQNALSSVKAL